MTFLEELTRTTQSAASVWHQFVVAHSPGSDDWYLFIEGRLDAPFYKSTLRSHIRDEARIFDFRCKGKRGVYEARSQIRQSHANCTRVLFLVDKDLDDLVNSTTSLAQPDDVFCTEYYSIENYFVSEQALDAVWQHLWCLPTSDPNWNDVLLRFRRSLELFHRLMTPIMAWAVLARRAGERPNLNNLNLANIVVFQDCLPRTVAGALRRVQQETSCHYRPTLRALADATRILRTYEPKHVIRGKFELWMFSRFLDGIWKALRSRECDRPSASIPPSGVEGLALALVGKLAPPTQLEAFFRRALSRTANGHCRG